MKPNLLSGVRIIDLSTYVAAPSAGKLMADWGAEVIKVETADGDPMRKFGDQMGIVCNDDENPIWELENGNKKGLCLDLKTAKGQEVMEKLLEGADGFISNVRLGSLKKLGLDYETLSVKFPKLVWGNISGFGLYGPEAPRPGYDVVSFWARGGALGDNSPIGHPPITTPYGVGDHTTSLVLLSGMLAGIMRARQTGQGEKIVASLYGTAVWVNGLMIISTQFGDSYPKDRYQPPSPLGNAYLCKDGSWLTLTILAYERYWDAFCEAMEISDEFRLDERYRTLLSARVPENNRTLCHLLEDTFIQRESSYWMERLAAADIAFERCLHYSEISQDPQAIENHFVAPHTLPNGRTFMLPMTPVQFANNEALDCASAPLIGEHTDEILGGLGYSVDEILAMRAEKAII